jgi:putative MFS transporter
MSDGTPAPAMAHSANEAAVGSVLDTLRSFRHRFVAPVLLGLVLLFDSWDSIAIAYAMPSLSAEWHLNPLEMGFIISAGYGGQFIGAFSLGAVAERYGRLPVLLAAVTAMGLLAIGCSIAAGYTSLLLLRLIQGLMIGGALPVAITYINELAPTATRGRYFGIFQTLAISGFAAASVSSPFIIPALGWRWMLGLGAIPIILVPVVWTLLPESPRWLARIGRLDAANRALIKLGGKPAKLLAERAVQPDPGAPAPVKARMAALALIAPAMRQRTLTVTLLWLLTMFTSFGLTTWVPSIYVNVFHIPVERALRYTASTSLLILVVMAGTGYMIDRFGRRPFGMGGLLVTAAALLVLALFQPSREAVLVGLVVTGQVAIFFGAFVLWPYTAETYPTDLRALGIGYGSAIGRAASMLTPLFVGFVLNQGAPIAIVFISFGLSALGALATWWMRTSETAGKPLDAV